MPVDTYISNVLRTLQKDEPEDYSGLGNVGDVDIKKAYQVVCSVESNCDYAIGDTGTAFGATQVQLGGFLQGLAQDPKVQSLTGMDPAALEKLGSTFEKSQKALRGENFWLTVPVNEEQVKTFMRNNPKMVVRRREGTTVRYSPENYTIVKFRGGRPIGYRLDLAKLSRLGLDLDSPRIKEGLQNIVKRYLTDGVARAKIASLITYQADPKTYLNFRRLFSRDNVRGNQKLKNLADRVSQRDFTNRVKQVVSMVEEYGYDVTSPNSYNIYQLIALANNSGIGRVRKFLKDKKPFASGNLHYLQRANPTIAKITGLSSSFPRDGMGGFKATASLKKDATFRLQFPSQYAEDLRSGKREMTIRPADIPVQVEEVVRCETYSGAPICDVKITSKEVMSVTRIRKAFGKKIANDLEKRFGPDARFYVIRFHRCENELDDDYSNNNYFRDSEPVDLQHTPSGRGIMPVNPNYYHASYNISIRASLEQKQIQAIWNIADSLPKIAATPEEEEAAKKWMREHGFGEDDEEFGVLEDEEEKKSEEEEPYVPKTLPPAAAPSATPPPPTEKPEQPKKPGRRYVPFSQVVKQPEEVEEEKREPTAEELFKSFMGEEEPEETPMEDLPEEEAKPRGIETKKTIWGFRLEPPENNWEGEVEQPKISPDIDQVFKPEAFDDAESIRELFMVDEEKGWEGKAWSALKKASPEEKKQLLQKWVLPALLYNIGKRWFDINHLKANIGGTPFRMFGPTDIERAAEAKIPLAKTEKGKMYKDEIAKILTGLVNDYFSQDPNESKSEPIDRWLYFRLNKTMLRKLGDENGYQRVNVPLCSICFSEKSKKTKMVEEGKGTGLWSCPDCVEDAKRIEVIDVADAQSRVKQLTDRQEKLRGDVLRARVAIEDIGKTPETLKKLQIAEEMDDAGYVELQAAREKLKELTLEVDKYSRQQRVPRYHVWCINEDCDGQKVPLTHVDWGEKEFWNSEKGKIAAEYLSKKFGLSAPLEQQASEFQQSRVPTTSIVPDEQMMDVPFRCPYDGAKFTPREAMGKGPYNQGGLLWQPWFAQTWTLKGRVEPVKTDVGDAKEGVYFDDLEEVETYKKFAEMARNIILKKYWDKFEQAQQYRAMSKFLNPKTDSTWLGMIQNLKLYDSLRSFSAAEPSVYVGWLADREFKSKLVKQQDGTINSVMTVGSSRKKQDEIYIPILQKWFDDMTREEDGFVKYGLRKWLVDEDKDGIPSYPKTNDINQGKEGTYFIVRSDQQAQMFNSNLVAKKRKGGRGFGTKPQIIRIIGAWELNNREAVALAPEIMKGLKALPHELALRLKANKDNSVRDIEAHDFYGGRFNPETSQFAPNKYILIQAYLMPAARTWPPFRKMRDMRKDADGEHLFENLGKLALMNEDDPKFWGDFRKEIEKHKKDPEKMKELVLSKLEQAKKAKMRAWNIKLSTRDRCPLSVRHYGSI